MDEEWNHVLVLTDPKTGQVTELIGPYLDERMANEVKAAIYPDAIVKVMKRPPYLRLDLS